MARSSASSSERLGRLSGPPAAGPRVYLDYAGFSPVDPRVVAMMRPFLEGGIGNPNAQHSLGLEARASLDGARAKVARLFGAAPAGVVPVPVDTCHIDLLTLSSNDLYGPPGAGALWVRPTVKLAPLTVGGGQEQGYRSGTENLPAIAGMGVAADLARVEVGGEAARLGELRDRLLSGLLARISEARLTGPAGTARLPHHVSIVVPGVKAESVLMELDLRGIAASSGATCTAMTGEPSYVLRAIG